MCIRDRSIHLRLSFRFTWKYRYLKKYISGLIYRSQWNQLFSFRTNSCLHALYASNKFILFIQWRYLKDDVLWQAYHYGWFILSYRIWDHPPYPCLSYKGYFHYFQTMTSIHESDTPVNNYYHISLDVKRRYIDPLLCGKRISTQSEEAASLIHDIKVIRHHYMLISN